MALARLLGRYVALGGEVANALKEAGASGSEARRGLAKKAGGGKAQKWGGGAKGKQAQGKKAKQAKRTTSASDESKHLKALERRPVVEEPELPKDKEEAKRLAKEYSRKRMKKHREMQKDLEDKINLKNMAIRALPEELQGPAMEPELTPLPFKRPFPTDTPKKPGYYEERQKAFEGLKTQR